MKCPYCGHQRFFFKDPEDEFETFAFDCETGQVCFDPDLTLDDIPPLENETRIFCDKCAWNGAFSEIR